MEASTLSLLLVLLSCLKGTESTGTPPPAGDWTVQDNLGNTCMRLSFAAQYIIKIGEFNNHVVNIEPSSYASSKCASPTRFVDFFPKLSSTLYKLQLRFTLNANTNSYAMTRVLASFPDNRGSTYPVSYYVDSTNFLENNVTIGKAYICADQLTLDIGGVIIYIWDMHLQPFAGDSGGGFGPDRPCGPEPTTSGPPIIIIVTCSVVGGVVLIALAVTVTVIVVIRHRKRHQYSRIQG